MTREPGLGEAAELLALQELRDAALDLLAAEADGARTDADVAPVRARAVELYRAYVDGWGPLNRGLLVDGAPDAQTGLPSLTWRRPDLGGFRRDPDYLTVMALEVYDPETGAAEPAPILLRRVHGNPQPRERVANVDEALVVALGEGPLDLHRIAQLIGLSDARAAQAELGSLAYRDPAAAGAWVTARDYLSGDVRAKLIPARAAAHTDPAYRRNVEALLEAIPPDLGPLDIAVSLGAPWISTADIEAFVHEVMGGRVRVWHLPSAANWRIVPLGKIPVQAGRYGTARLGPYQVLAAGLNGRTPMVFDTEAVPGRRLRIRNGAESLAAQEKLTELQERFRTWVWEDEHRSARLVAEYNRRFNTHVVRRHDGTRLTFPDLADGVALWPWQRDIVAQIVSSPATLCAHAVGAGKTRSMVCAAMTARRLGVAAKPLIAVPAHLVEQVAREARQAYPFGRFLIADGQPRAAIAARCATGEWDAVIISHGLFSNLPVAPEAELASLGEQAAELDRQLRAGKGGRHGRSVLRRRLAAVDAQRERVRIAPRPSITFDDLGVDLILIDEAHYFKRLPIVSRMEGVSLGSSQRAADLLLKARILRSRRGRRPSLALFTGTPWSNTIAETFVWQTLVQPDLLADAGVEHFDAWASVFVEYETSVEVTPDGSGMRLMQRPARIRNLPELRRMLSRSADVLRPHELGLDRPDHREHTEVCEPSPGQLEYVGSLGARVDKIRRERVRAEPGGDNMLAVCGDGRRAALDPRLVGVPETSSKVTALVERVALIHHENAEVRFAGSDVAGVFQLVFCDQGTPGADGPQTYGRIRIELAARGIPAEQVRWVHEARTPAQRAQLFADCRAGAVSVLIGSTDKLGVGTNVQARLRAIHHADAPWRPSDIEQREGRALRPGNLNPLVDIVRYVTRGTFDAYMWQTLQRKAGFVEQLYRTDPGTRSIDDLGDAALTFAEVKALATGNPLLLEHAQATADVARLRLLHAIDTQTLTSARGRLDEVEQDEYQLLQQVRMLRSARQRLADVAAPGDGTDVQSAAAALHARLARPLDHEGPAPIRAPWRGLGIELIPTDGWAATVSSVELRVTLAHRRVDVVSLPGTLLRRSRTACERSVLAQLTRWLDRLDTRIVEVEQAALDADEAATAAKNTIARHRFGRMDELAAAEAHLAEITVALESTLDPHNRGAA